MPGAVSEMRIVSPPSLASSLIMQRVAAGAGVDVQRAGDPVEVARQEVRPVGEAVVRLRGDVDAVVAGAEVEVRDGARALDVEDVVAGAELMFSVSTP